jgi:hypothetical protein
MSQKLTYDRWLFDACGYMSERFKISRMQARAYLDKTFPEEDLKSMFEDGEDSRNVAAEIFFSTPPGQKQDMVN